MHIFVDFQFSRLFLDLFKQEYLFDLSFLIPAFLIGWVVFSNAKSWKQLLFLKISALLISYYTYEEFMKNELLNLGYQLQITPLIRLFIEDHLVESSTILALCFAQVIMVLLILASLINRRI
jgi:hypothetical protein